MRACFLFVTEIVYLCEMMKRLVILFIVVLGAMSVGAVDYDGKFSSLGFVDVHQLDSTIVIDLKYSGTDNFMGVNMYGDLRKAYLQLEIADRLLKAQQLLREKSNDYTLVVYDAARPLSAQKIMFDKVQGTEFEQYVANPYNGGGHHCYGCAVDVTILYKGEPLDMGTGFDSFSEVSHTDNEQANLANGTLTQKAYQNRLLLRGVMTAVGFEVEPCEWWHFSCYKIEYVREKFPRLDF